MIGPWVAAHDGEMIVRLVVLAGGTPQAPLAVLAGGVIRDQLAS